MRVIVYLTGIALFVAALVSLLLGMSDFHACILLCAGLLLVALSCRWIVGKKEQRTDGLILMFAFCAYVIFNTLTADQPNLAFSLFRQTWFGISFLLAVSFTAVFLAIDPVKLRLTRRS